jgi:virulence factor Mce-like protein
MEELAGGKRASALLGAVVATAIASVVGLASVLSIGAGDSSYHLHAHYQTANGIIDGSDVFIAGVKVGIVSDVSVSDNGEADITMSIDRRYSPVHQGATAFIRPKSLLGEKYVDLSVGDISQPTVPDDGRLPDSATQVNVELDQLINTFDAPTRKQLQVLINELGAGLAGQGRNTNQTIQSGTQDLSALANVTDVLQKRDTELKATIEALTKVTATLASDQQRSNYVDLLAHSNKVLLDLRQEDADVQQGIDRMNQLFGEFDAGLSGRGQDLQAIAADLPVTLTDLDALSVNLAAKGHIGYPIVVRGMGSVVGGDLIFGSQPDKTVFTKDVFTRVMPAQGCYSANSRTTDASGNVKDTGTPITQVCTVAGGLPAGCATTPPSAGCVTGLQSALCAIYHLPGCPAAAAGTAPTSQLPVQVPSAPLPGAGPPSVLPTPLPNSLQREAQHDLLWYLLK